MTTNQNSNITNIRSNEFIPNNVIIPNDYPNNIINNQNINNVTGTEIIQNDYMEPPVLKDLYKRQSSYSKGRKSTGGTKKHRKNRRKSQKRRKSHKHRR